jgi:uncharacterized protein YjiS (DUF1127 family)
MSQGGIMDTALLSQGLIELLPGEPLSLRDAADRHIGVVHGTVWVTQEGDQRDHVVHAGEHFRFDRGGHTLVMSLGGAAKLVLENGLISERQPQPQVISITRDNWFIHLPELVHEARRKRDEAIGQAFVALFVGLKTLWRGVTEGVSAAIRKRRSARELSCLNDHTLRDIGLSRDQVDCR